MRKLAIGLLVAVSITSAANAQSYYDLQMESLRNQDRNTSLEIMERRLRNLEMQEQFNGDENSFFAQRDREEKRDLLRRMRECASNPYSYCP